MRKPRICGRSMTVVVVLAATVAAAAHAQTSMPVQRSVLRHSSLPTELQSGLSAVLGRDASAYRAQALRDGFDATNPRQKLTVHFNSAGVEVRSGTARWLMAVRGYGYGETMQKVGAAVPEANLNRIDYRRGGLTEWYVNGPIGLEQGFTLSSPGCK